MNFHDAKISFMVCYTLFSCRVEICSLFFFGLTDQGFKKRKDAENGRYKF